MPISIKRLSSVCALGVLCSFQAFGDPLPLSEQKLPLYVTGNGTFFLSENTSIVNFDASLSTTALLGSAGNFSIDGKNRSLFISGCQGPQKGIPLILAENTPPAAQQQQQSPSSTSYSMTLSGLHTFSFLNNTAFSTEGVISAGSIKWNNNKNIVISKNTTVALPPASEEEEDALAIAATEPPTPTGGIVKAKESISITNTSDTVYFGENSSDYGGALRIEEKTSPQPPETLTTNGVTLISNNPGSVSFEGNKASSSGGAIFGGSAFFTSNEGSIQFLRNSCTGAASESNYLGSGGAISLPSGLAAFQNNGGSIIFTKNTATGNGGAIYAKTFQASGNTGTMLFADNTSAKKGGAIRAEIVSIEATSNVVFSNNIASGDGGAILVDSLTSNRTTGTGTTSNGIKLPGSSLSLFANSGDIIFMGNIGAAGTRNAIAVGASTSIKQLSANAGHTIAFYDPITEVVSQPSAVSTFSSTDSALVLNDGTSGKILFSGKFAPKSSTPAEKQTKNISLANSKDAQSKINAAVTLAGGILEITEGASLEVSSFTQSGGHLVLGSGSTLKTASGNTGPNITNVLIDLSTFPKESSTPAKIEITTSTNGDTHTLATLEAEKELPTSAEHTASTLELSPTPLPTMNPSEGPSNTMVPESGSDKPNTLETLNPEREIPPTIADGSNPSSTTLLVSPRTFSVSGVQVVDTEGSSYYDKEWEKPHTVTILSLSATASPSISTQTVNREGTDYGYHGTWTISEATNGERTGTTKTIQAQWTPDGTFFLPYNRRGEIVANTLWSTLSAVDAFATTAYESPFEAYEGKRLVAEGIGSFLVGKTEKDSERDGFRFEGGGYGVCFGSSYNGFSSGVALGQIFGKTRSKLYPSKSTENAFLGTFYAAAPIPFLFRELETVASFVLGYGFVENTLKTDYPENSVFTAMKTSEGKWDNRGAILRIRFTNCLPPKHFDAITPSSGLREIAFFFGPELSGVRQSSFIERGAPARAFQRGKGFVISLPVGIAYQAHLHVGKNATHIRTSFMYKPDIYRDNPHTRLMLLENGREYRVDGAHLPKNAFRLDAQGATKISNHFECTAGYSFEGRNSVCMHRASVTLGRIF
ncbi:polymorphic outer membrane protein middle domain-containing protein [Chlamydiifrater volucris]|uniref:polymorphic outer membrane protein middle domain-containing protein n=1 Tax=Chlamydiifrater volucris TaxID=2681470 RepID=UPI001BCECA81|nr:polymorphic outer membrane protein middle domain-containing protein [Chlamydiifrater volucris]